jgi:hypothetical protein
MAIEYTPDTINDIWAGVQKIQGKRRVRALTRKDIKRALQTVETQPYGQITIDARCGGRKVPQKGKKTKLNIYWYSWRRKKWIVWWAACVSVKPEDDQQTVIATKHGNKRSAWLLVFPDRCLEYNQLTTKRRLIRRGYVLPPNIQNICVVEERYGMALITGQESGRYSAYLCSPLGYIETDRCYTIYDTARNLGIKLPGNIENRTWADIEPQWIMAQLRKL